jgi:hypothetical protein
MSGHDDGHVLLVHAKGECPNHNSEYPRDCMFCDGGLSACTRCGAFEGAWPDQCPGERMSYEQSEAVYQGRLNYRDGAWYEGECCQVMRPTYDREAFIAERIEESR